MIELIVMDDARYLVEDKLIIGDVLLIKNKLDVNSGWERGGVHMGYEWKHFYVRKILIKLKW